MGEALRKTGLDVLGDVPWGTHVCQFYETAEDLVSIMVPYFRAGLESDELCVWVASEPLPAEEARRVLAGAVPALDRYIEKRQIEILDYSEWYTRSGEFDIDRALEAWLQKEQEAAQRGFAGLRAAGNMLRLQSTDARLFGEYEARVDESLAGHRIIAICSCPSQSCSPSTLVEAASRHRGSLIKRDGGWHLVESARRRRTEEELQQSGEWLRAVVDTAACVVVHVSPDGRIIDFNREATRVTGWEREQVVGKHYSWLIPEASRATAGAEFERALANGSARHLEMAVSARDGTPRILAWNTTRLRDSSGRVSGVVGFGIDVTERRRADETLRRSERELAIRNRIVEIFLAVPDEEMYGEVLQVIQEALDSKHGLFGYVDEHGALVLPSLTREIWDRCRVPGKSLVFPPESWGGIWGRALREQRTIRSNRRGRVPKGHIPIRRALIVPVLYRGQAIGILEVANKATDYDDEDQQLLEAIAHKIAPILHARLQRDREERERARADEALRQAHDQLEARVDARTAQLARANEELQVEIAERRQAEAKLARLNRLYSVLSRINEAIVRIRDPQQLYEEACRIVVEDGLFRMAWVGLVESEAGLVEPVARWGAGSGYLDDARVAVADVPEGRGPTGTAIREDRHIICNDIEHDPRMGPWRDAALSRGYRSSAAFPLRLWSRPVGALNLYAAEPRFFSEDEIQLLRRLADNVSFAIGAIELDGQRRAEEERRRELEAQMLHAQKLESLGVLAGGIAHDFNNLLVSVLGNAGLALMDLPPGSPGHSSVRQIETAAQHAAELTQLMLAYSGKGKFLPQPVDLSRLVVETTHLLEVAIPKKAFPRYELAADLPPIEADPTQVRQVVMNLVTNAAEALADQSGVITVRTGAVDADRAYLSDTYLNEELAEGRYVYLEVSDTGHGMDAETSAKIFDPFFSTKFAGRGLGLAAVLGIVRGHHGAIKVYSEPGRGTTFTVLFPVAVKPERATPAPTPPSAGEWQGSGVVLVADDERGVRAVAKVALERSGFSVLTATNGREAVAVFREHADEIAAVLLDMTMPEMDGREAYREIRGLRPDVRVILSSGYGEEDAAAGFDGEGPAAFLQKPWQATTLVEKVRELLEA